MIEESDEAYDPIQTIRGFVDRFRKQGIAYQGAQEQLNLMVEAAEVLARLYEQRTEHLEDVIEERGRYYHELKHLRARARFGNSIH